MAAFEAANSRQATRLRVRYDFDVLTKRLDIRIDFVRGSTFSFEQDGAIGKYKAYDTVEKEWRHLNFFEHECYLKARVPRIKTPDDKIHLGSCTK